MDNNKHCLHSFNYFIFMHIQEQNKKKKFRITYFKFTLLWSLSIVILNPYHAEFLKWNNPSYIFGIVHYIYIGKSRCELDVGQQTVQRLVRLHIFAGWPGSILVVHKGYYLSVLARQGLIGSTTKQYIQLMRVNTVSLMIISYVLCSIIINYRKYKYFVRHNTLFGLTQ